MVRFVGWPYFLFLLCFRLLLVGTLYIGTSVGRRFERFYRLDEPIEDVVGASCSSASSPLTPPRSTIRKMPTCGRSRSMVVRRWM
jgi:hypothetical protein